MNTNTYFTCKSEADVASEQVVYMVTKPRIDAMLHELDQMVWVQDIEHRSQMVHHYGKSLTNEAERMFLTQVGYEVYFGYVDEAYRTSTILALKVGRGKFKGHDRLIVWATSPEELFESQLEQRRNV